MRSPSHPSEPPHVPTNSRSKTRLQAANSAFSHQAPATSPTAERSTPSPSSNSIVTRLLNIERLRSAFRASQTKQEDGLCLVLEPLLLVNRIDYADALPNGPCP